MAWQVHVAPQAVPELLDFLLSSVKSRREAVAPCAGPRGQVCNSLRHPARSTSRFRPVQDGFKVLQTCSTCLRGMVATRDLEVGENIMEVPFTAVLHLR